MAWQFDIDNTDPILKNCLYVEMKIDFISTM